MEIEKKVESTFSGKIEKKELYSFSCLRYDNGQETVPFIAPADLPFSIYNFYSSVFHAFTTTHPKDICLVSFCLDISFLSAL